MKYKKSTIMIALCAVIAVIVVILCIRQFSASTPGSSVTDITTTGGNIKYYSTDYGTHFDIEIYEGSIILLGREVWEKDDEIMFRVSTHNSEQLEVGILPAESMENGWGYNDYGHFFSSIVDADEKVQEVSFTVPQTGEYGIGILHVLSSQKAEKVDLENIQTRNITLDVNKKFNNPMVK